MRTIRVLPCYPDVSPKLDTVAQAGSAVYRSGTLGIRRWHLLQLRDAAILDRWHVGATYSSVATGRALRTHWLFYTGLDPKPPFGVTDGPGARVLLAQAGLERTKLEKPPNVASYLSCATNGPEA